MHDDDLDDYMKKRIIWFNKEDLLDSRKLTRKVVDVFSVNQLYGVCFVLTEDLPIETVERIFDGKKR